MYHVCISEYIVYSSGIYTDCVSDHLSPVNSTFLRSFGNKNVYIKMARDYNNF